MNSEHVLRLANYDPCYSGMMWFASQDTPQQAWETCIIGDWMLWALAQTDVDVGKLQECCIDCLFAWKAEARRYVETKDHFQITKVPYGPYQAILWIGRIKTLDRYSVQEFCSWLYEYNTIGETEYKRRKKHVADVVRKHFPGVPTL